MRLCFFGNYSAGGTERAAFCVANQLARAFPRYEVFLLNLWDRPATFSVDSDARYHFLRKRDEQRGKMRHVISTTIQLRKFLKKNKIDILINVEAMLCLYSFAATLGLPCRNIIWDHANYYQSQNTKWLPRVRKWAVRHRFIDHYVVLTQRDLRNFQSHYKVKCPLTCIHNAVAFPAEPCDYDLHSQTIVSAGHINRIKNYIIIPDIAKIIFSRYPDWKWEIYGSDVRDGSVLEELQEKIKQYGLQDKVLLCGRTNDMDGVYQKAALYVLTSLQEGLPLVLLEAKAHGLPLVSFDIETGPDEIIRDGVNGCLVPPYDIEIMAKKICGLMEDSGLRKEFSDNAALDMQKFDIDDIIGQWNTIFEGMNIREDRV
ncbi:MAG: glycosyltransferase family 4 protein [Clostridiales bacterium]|nr:glycosyltransferase family 4 protein [Clostridiales bacterium]